MNVTAAVLALLVAVALAIGVTLLFVAPEEPAGDELAGNVPERLDHLLNRMESYERAQARLEERLGAKIDELAARPAPEPGLTAEDVRREIARAFAEHAPGADGPPPPAAGRGADPDFDLRAALARMADPETGYEDREALWKTIAAAGRVDDAIAYFQKKAESMATDPDVQTDLGEAYIQKLQLGNISQKEQGVLATKADAAYAKALELDDQHWRARFNKAVSLSFWPPALGRQGEAIRHFETLVDQQATRDPDPGHAFTHLFLGNMYEQMGQHEKAVAAWQVGLSRFPNNESLRNQIRNSRH